MGIIFNLVYISLCFELLNDFLASDNPIIPYVNLCRFTQGPIRIKNVYSLQVVSFADLIIIWIMCRSNFERTCPKLPIYIIIENDRYCSIDDRYDNIFAFVLLIAFILRMYCHGGIPHDSFGTSSSNDDMIISSFYLILHMTQSGCFILM